MLTKLSLSLQMKVVPLLKAENPIKQLRDLLKFNWGLFEGLSFLFWILAVPYTLGVIGLLIYGIWSIIHFLFLVNKGQKNLGDKGFWIRVGVTIFVVFLLISGLAWDVLEAIYNWTATQDVTGANDAKVS